MDVLLPSGCMNSNQSAISQNLHFEDARAFSRPHWVVVKHTARQRWVLARLEEDCLLGQRLREHSFGREGNASSVVRGCYAYDVIISAQLSALKTWVALLGTEPRGHIWALHGAKRHPGRSSRCFTLNTDGAVTST